MQSALGAFTNPDSVALIGASENSSLSTEIVDNLQEIGWGGDLFYVNPSHDRIYGEPCYPSVTAIDGRIDLAVIIVPAGVVVDVFEDCCEGGVRAALILTGGFDELGGEGIERAERLRRLSEQHEVPICGPNSVGIVSATDQFAATIMTMSDVEPGNIGIVTQSGGLLVQLVRSAIERSLGFSSIIDCGNQTSVSASQYIEHLLEDDKTQVIACIIEGFQDPDRFKRIAAMANEQGTPLVILKLARSESGQRSAKSHTGTLTAAHEVVASVFERTGVVSVDSLGGLIEAMELFSKVNTLPGNGVALVDNSGGGATLVADCLVDTSLRLATLSKDTLEELSAHVPAIGSHRNPIDVVMKFDQDGMGDRLAGIFGALNEDPAVDVVLIRMNNNRQREHKRRFEADRLADIEAANGATDTQYVGFTRPRFKIFDEWSEIEAATDLPVLNDYNATVETVDALYRYTQRERVPEDWLNRTPTSRIDSTGLDEREAKYLLADWDIRTTAERVANSPGEAETLAADIGYPVCLKALSRELEHKNDLGLVHLDLRTPEEVRKVYGRIIEDCPDDIDLTGVLVQELVTGGHELLVGSKRSDFGQAITVAAGGIYTEVLDDSVTRIAPVTEAEARSMVETLRIAPILEGDRGNDPMALDSFAALIARFAAFAADTANLVEADLNPVIVTADKAVVADALFVVDDAPADGG